MRITSLIIIVGLFNIQLLLGYSLKSAISETSPISMTTGQTRYARGDIIQLVVTNNLNIPIWYIDYTQPDLVFWTIERAKENRWRNLGFRLPLIENGKEVCRMTMYERPIGAVMDIKPHSDLVYKWNQKICLLKIISQSTGCEMIEKGRYRFGFRYSLDTVKLENPEIEPWKRPIDLDQIKVVYSNEFILE